MVKCSDDCPAICIYCKHFDLIEIDEYHCDLHSETTHPTDDCDDFACVRSEIATPDDGS